MSNVAIITGVSGQDGSYLAKILVDKGYKVVGLVRNSERFSNEKLNYLSIADKVTICEANLLDYDELLKIFLQYRPNKVFNFASQSSSGLSYSKPRETIEFNIQSVINLLECIRLTNEKAKFFQASSSEIFGQPKDLPVNEQTPICPNNLYGISKATAHQIIDFYRDYYKLSIVVAIFLNHESALRGDNFVVKKIVRDLCRIKRGELNVLRVGNISAKRDFGYAPNYMKLIYKMANSNHSDNYVVSTGVSVSVRNIITYVLGKLNLDHSVVKVDPALYRDNDIADIYGDSAKAIKTFDWHYDVDFFSVLDEMISYEQVKFND